MLYLIFGILVVMFLVSGCSFWWADPEYYKTKELGRKYGVFYIFDKQFADEIKQREKDRKEFDKKILDMSATDEEFRQNSKKYDVDKALPQTLSNGCKYYFTDPSIQELKENDWTPYYDKIKECIGAENYNNIVQHFLRRIDSYYKCNEKIYPITIHFVIPYIETTYGIFGDEGRGFYLSSSRARYFGNTTILYLIDGKFVRSNKNYYEEY